MISGRKATSVERFFTRSPFSIVTMVARIKENVTEEMLRNAVGKVQQRYFLLRVRIKDDDNHEQRFTTEGVQEIPIDVIALGFKKQVQQDDVQRIHQKEF